MALCFKRAMTTRTYSDAISLLNGLQTNFSVIDAIRKAGTVRSNEVAIPEMLEWARRAGYPDPTVFDKLNAIHVTGTKGKGSTCAFVQSILLQYRTCNDNESADPIHKIGLYTSPHLKSVRERIRINGESLSEAMFAKYFFEVWDALESTNSDVTKFDRMEEGLKPNYFRYLTLLSFHVFLREKVDTAIYEVGIGGEYDSTNILVHPSATGVSALGLDHTHILGDTIAKIARNKAGIFKTGTKAFTCPQPEEALEALETRAREKDVSLTIVSYHPQISEITLGLAGEFQKQNASLAIELAAERLRRGGMTDLDVSKALPDKFVKGLEETNWPGRCQTKRDGEITWYLDGAHTKESIPETAKWFGSVATKRCKKILIFNQQTRDANALIELLYSKLLEFDKKFDVAIFTTNVTWSSGAFSPDLVSHNVNKSDVDKLVVQNALAEAWKKLDSSTECRVVSNIEDGLNFVRSLNEPVEVLVTGSLLMVGGFLTVLEDPRPNDE